MTRRRRLAFALACALLPACPAPATSFSDPDPHDPKLACEAIKRVVAGFNAGRLGDPDSWKPGPTFFSDSFGEVEEAEEAAFLHSMRHSEGRPDEKPIELRDVRIVHKDEDDPLYLVVLDRESWHEKRLTTDELLMPIEIDDPHFETDTNFWLVRFMSNALTDFREAPEVHTLWLESKKLKHCY